VSQWEGPETQVTSRVGDCTKYELDCVDHRMDEDVTKFIARLGLVHFLELIL
jgi:hypothetical protein